MGSIVCRHREHTIFERLSDNYNNASLAFYWEGVRDDKKHMSLRIDPKSFSARLERDNECIKMKWFKANKKGLESPDKVLKDVQINENVFISLCGYICSTNDYEPTEDTYDVTEIVSDIISQQPIKTKEGFYRREKTDIKHKIIKFNEIPSELYFVSVVGSRWKDSNWDVAYRRNSKYWKEPVNSSNVKSYQLAGALCPFVDEGYYENINFHEIDSIWYNPGKKYVQINHAVTPENFFDRDGFLCSTDNYRFVTKEEVDNYYKKFLFLI